MFWFGHWVLAFTLKGAGMSFNLVSDDILLYDVDAIVNAANVRLACGGGICGKIFAKAGAYELALACNNLAPIRTSDAVITKGFNLKAKYIIHAAGPVYSFANAKICAQLLYNTYQNALKLAKENDVKSIAFPLISSGIYGYPKAEAYSIAKRSILDFLAGSDMCVYLSILDRKNVDMDKDFLGQYSDLFDELKGTHESTDKSTDMNELNMLAQKCDIKDDSFSDLLDKKIQISGFSKNEVFKNANLDVSFLTMLANPPYTLTKASVFALAISLKLSFPETLELLKSAGFKFLSNSKEEVAIKYFIDNKIFDINLINEVFFTCDLATLGGAC